MKVRRQEGCCKTRWREVPSREPRKRDREREREGGGGGGEGETGIGETRQEEVGEGDQSASR